MILLVRVTYHLTNHLHTFRYIFIPVIYIKVEHLLLVEHEFSLTPLTLLSVTTVLSFIHRKTAIQHLLLLVVNISWNVNDDAGVAYPFKNSACN